MLRKTWYFLIAAGILLWVIAWTVYFLPKTDNSRKKPGLTSRPSGRLETKDLEVDVNASAPKPVREEPVDPFERIVLEQVCRDNHSVIHENILSLTLRLIKQVDSPSERQKIIKCLYEQIGQIEANARRSTFHSRSVFNVMEYTARFRPQISKVLSNMDPYLEYEDWSRARSAGQGAFEPWFGSVPSIGDPSEPKKGIVDSHLMELIPFVPRGQWNAPGNGFYFYFRIDKSDTSIAPPCVIYDDHLRPQKVLSARTYRGHESWWSSVQGGDADVYEDRQNVCLNEVAHRLDRIGLKAYVVAPRKNQCYWALVRFDEIISDDNIAKVLASLEIRKLGKKRMVSRIETTEGISAYPFGPSDNKNRRYVLFGYVGKYLFVVSHDDIWWAKEVTELESKIGSVMPRE